MKLSFQTIKPALVRCKLRVVMVAALTLGPFAGAQANETKFDLGQGVTFRYYGWLHLAGQLVDDGVTTTSELVDASNAASRFGFYIEPDGDGIWSFQFETSLGLRPSSRTSQTNTPDAWRWTRRNLRKVQVMLRSSVGTFRLGQGSMPTDGVAESDLGKTVVVAKSTIPESYGALEFRTNTGALSGVTIAETFRNFDGARRFRVRFDTAGISGFSVAVAYGQEVLRSGNTDEYYDIALRYAGAAGEFDIKGAIGSSYVRAASSTRRNATIGSVSVLHRPTGLNFSVAGGQAGGQAGGNGGTYVYAKGGWSGDLLPAGATKFLIEGFRGKDYLTASSRSTMWGLAMIQEFEARNLEVYAGYRGFSFDDSTPAAYRDMDALQIGARWRF